MLALWKDQQNCQTLSQTNQIKRDKTDQNEETNTNFTETNRIIKKYYE